MTLSGLLVVPGTSHCSSSPAAFVITNKRRKKKKKKKPSPQNNSGQEPPRITSNVRQNLQYFSLLKDYQKRSAPKAPTSYRRKKVVKEPLPEDEDVHQDPDAEPPVLGTAVRVLLVDGYNVCGYWPKLKKHFAGGRLDLARQMLIDELVTFSFVEGIKVVVAFDAMLSGLPTHYETFRGIDIVFSGHTTADTWIEKEVVALAEDGCHEVCVATSDILHQQMAYALGATIWSCAKLISEIEASQWEYQKFLEQQRPIFVKEQLLRYSLDPKIIRALKDLRRHLAENESRNRNVK